MVTFPRTEHLIALASSVTVVLLAACHSGRVESLDSAGWSAEPYLVGAEPRIEQVSPTHCEPFFLALEASNAEANVKVRGYKHHTGAYLLIKEWPESNTGYEDLVTNSARECRSMTMAYGPATVQWDIRRLDHPLHSGGSIKVRVTDDAEDVLADMLIKPVFRDGRAYLIRVMNTEGSLGSIEEQAIELSLKEIP